MSLQVWLPLTKDISNYGLSGVSTTSVNSASISAGGKLGNCLTLSSDGQAVSLNSYMNVCSTYRTYSMCAWVFMNSTATNHSSSILSSGDWNSSTGQCCFGFYNYSSGYTKLLVPNKKSWSEGISLSTSAKLSTWYHVCITYDGSTTRAYINGSYVGSYSGGGITASSNNSNLYVGCATYYSGFTLKGKINDLRIYDHCLSSKEIREISKGLTLHYPMNDPYIEPTTNIYNRWSTDCYNGVTGKYGYGTNTDIYYDVLDEDVIKVRMGTNNLDAWPFVYFNDLTPPSNGEYRTLSFDYYPTIKDKVNFYSWNTSGSITWVCNSVSGTGGDIPVNINSWNHLSVTIKNTGSASSGFGYMRIGTEKHTSSTSNYWLFKSIQIENKNHSTGYAGKNLSRSESLYSDCSGFGNNGIVKNQSSIYVERNSPRYTLSTVFNGTPYIIGQNLYGAKSIDALSLCAWINPSQVSGGYNIISSYEGGGAGLHISSGIIYFQIYSSGYVNVSGGNVTANTWYHIVGTYDNSSLKIYVNGELKGQVSKTGAITYNNATPWSIAVNPSGTSDGGEHYYGKLSDVRIYATALSADDVKELYNTSASIDKSGNTYAYEFIEG